MAIIIPGKNFIKKMGKLIDDYNEVIRFNSAPTKGFESCVGSKTTLNYKQCCFHNQTRIENIIKIILLIQTKSTCDNTKNIH